MDLPAGADLREPQYREEVWQRFYAFHLEHRSHPGCVYYLLPWLRDRCWMGEEETLWLAFLNGMTQHPPSTLMLWRQANVPRQARRMLAWVDEVYPRLAVDTDRRHHKSMIRAATEGYLTLIRRAGSQRAYWRAAAEDGFAGVWRAATAIPTFGRLSAFSFTEYLRIVDVPGCSAPCDTLMLGDREGSKSHRNGLCKVLGHDEWDWHASNPGFDGHYTSDMLSYLGQEAARLLAEAKARAAGKPWAGDVGYFTMESALCTYKSWFRPNRRYPNVYNDMLYDRLIQTEQRWGRESTAPFWAARQECVAPALRLEDNPFDPGLAPVKQNWFRNTGQVPVLFRDNPILRSDFDRMVDEGAFWLRNGATR